MFLTSDKVSKAWPRNHPIFRIVSEPVPFASVVKVRRKIIADHSDALTLRERHIPRSIMPSPMSKYGCADAQRTHQRTALQGADAFLLQHSSRPALRFHANAVWT